eukprot:2837752-Prymnesium_polylepis.1
MRSLHRQVPHRPAPSRTEAFRNGANPPFDVESNEWPARGRGQPQANGLTLERRGQSGPAPRGQYRTDPYVVCARLWWSGCKPPSETRLDAIEAYNSVYTPLKRVQNTQNNAYNRVTHTNYSCSTRVPLNGHGTAKRTILRVFRDERTTAHQGRGDQAWDSRALAFKAS